MSRWFSKTPQPEEIELQYVDKTVNIIGESLSLPDDDEIYNSRTELLDTRDKLRKIGSRLQEKDTLKSKLKRLFTKRDAVEKEYKGKRGFKSLYDDQITDTKERIKALEAEILELKQSYLSKINEISDSLQRDINEEKTLGERIKTTFKEKGLLIGVLFVITAVPAAFFSWIFGGGGGSGGSSGGGSKKNVFHNWVKRNLNALASLFGKLAAKAAAALPSILGAIVAGIFNLLKKIAIAAANHVWAVILAILSIISYALCDEFRRKKRK